jgi:hypothetical protein
MGITFAFSKLVRSRAPDVPRPLIGLALAAALVAACAGGSSSTPGSGGSSSGSAGNGTGGSVGSGGNSAGGNSGGGNSGTAGGSGGSAAGNSGSAGVGAGGNSVGSGGNSGGAGGNSTAGSGGGTAGNGSGGNVGSGGNSTGGTTGGAQAGRGGSSGGGSGAGGRGGAGGSGGGATGTGGSATAGATGTGGGGGTPGACPPDASFCSGFETAGQPANSTYLFDGGPGDWTRDFAIDSTQKHAGNSSLLVKNASADGTSGSAYRMLGVPVPAPGNKFWVRFWVRSDMVLGGPDHNAFVGPADGATTHATVDTLAEDVGISFHTLDGDVTWPTGYGRLQNGSTNPYSLPAMTWHCIEISYDLTTRHQQLYVGGSLLIDAANYPPAGSYASTTFATFQFGFIAFHGPPRQMWYDDVAVAPMRIGGCT